MASLAVSTPSADAAQLTEARRAVGAWFDEVESAMSPFREDSDLVRWRRGEAPAATLSPLLTEVIEAVRPLPDLTEGGFHPFDRSGRYDPTGYVKGWAVQRGTELLTELGLTDVCLGIGGDLQTTGRAAPDRPWQLAIADPSDPSRPAAIVRCADTGFAIATSGESQRGRHIWSAAAYLAPADPPVSDLASITVVGPRLSLADSFATAIWARSRTLPLHQAWHWLAQTEYEAVAVTSDGGLRPTPGMGVHLVQL